MEGNRRYVRVRAVLLAFLLSYYASDSDAFLDEMYIVIPHIIRVLMQRRDLAEEALRRARFQHHASTIWRARASFVHCIIYYAQSYMQLGWGRHAGDVFSEARANVRT